MERKCNMCINCNNTCDCICEDTSFEEYIVSIEKDNIDSNLYHAVSSNGNVTDWRDSDIRGISIQGGKIVIDNVSTSDTVLDADELDLQRLKKVVKKANGSFDFFDNDDVVTTVPAGFPTKVIYNSDSSFSLTTNDGQALKVSVLESLGSYVRCVTYDCDGNLVFQIESSGNCDSCAGGDIVVPLGGDGFDTESDPVFTAWVTTTYSVDQTTQNERIQILEDNSRKMLDLKGRVDTYDDLPKIGNDTGDTYFVGLETASEFQVYVWANDEWVLLGTQTIDLTDYYTRSQIDGFLSALDARITALETAERYMKALKHGTPQVVPSAGETVVTVDDDSTLKSNSDFFTLSADGFKFYNAEYGTYEVTSNLHINKKDDVLNSRTLKLVGKLRKKNELGTYDEVPTDNNVHYTTMVGTGFTTVTFKHMFSIEEEAEYLYQLYWQEMSSTGTGNELESHAEFTEGDVNNMASSLTITKRGMR